MNLATPEKIRTLQRKLYRKSREIPPAQDRRLGAALPSVIGGPGTDFTA
jgi:hypothetical protein